MARKNDECPGCDARDVAALWPSTPQVAGLPLPEIRARDDGLEAR